MSKLGTHNEVPYRTSTEVLMAAMEEFANCEPKAVLVVHINEDGDIVVSANTGKCTALGMIEQVKYMITRNEI